MVRVIWMAEAESELARGKDALMERLTTWKGEAWGHDYVLRRTAELMPDIRAVAERRAVADAPDASDVHVLPMHVLGALIDTPAWAIVFPTPGDRQGVDEFEIGHWYEEERESLRGILRALAAVPDDVMDAFLLIRNRNGFTRGKGEKARRLELDTAAGDVLRAMSQAWAHLYGNDSMDLLESRMSEQAFTSAGNVLDDLQKAQVKRRYLRMTDQGKVQIMAMPHPDEPSGEEDGTE